MTDLLDEDCFLQLNARFKKAPFWKMGVIGLICISQEYVVYKALAQDRFFDMSKFLDKTVERFWKALVTGYSMDEQYILAVEESFFEPRDGWEEMALFVVQDIYDYFYAVAEKDGKKALEMARRQMRLIEKFRELTGTDRDAVERIYAFQMECAREVEQVSGKEKKNFLEMMKNRALPTLLGEDFMRDRPLGKKEKPAKKKLPDIRMTSLDFDRDSEKVDRSWLLTATIRQLARGTADDSATHGMYSEAYDKKAFVDICHYMELQMRIDSEDVCVQARDYVKVRGFWYLSVLAGLRAWQLYETGCPVLFHNTKYDLEHWERESRTVFNKMLRAYAAGAEDLLPALMKFSPERKKTEALFRIMQGETGEELVTEVENWEWAEMREAFLAILSSDGKALKKAVLAMIRHDRKMYDLNRTMVDEYAYACLRLAKERGMKMETVAAVEVLEGRFDYPPVDREVFQLPYEDEIDAWLSSHGKEG